MAQRYQELDSLRGLAALTVVFSHFFAAIPLGLGPLAEGLALLSSFTPIASGYPAVVFFFILSGFALSLPFLRGEPPAYRSFLIRRVCRIYLPYLAAIFLGVLACHAFYRGSIPQLSNWFNNVAWSGFPSAGLIGAHVWMLGTFPDAKIDPVIWSLVHEMRISLVFPVLMLLVCRWNLRGNLILAVMISAAALALGGFLQAEGYDSNIPSSLHYSSFFILGALLAKHRVEVVERIRRMKPSAKATLLAGGLAAYTYSSYVGQGGEALFKVILHNPHAWVVSALTDWLIALGALAILAVALSSRAASKFLLRRPVAFLGRVSYSLYLVHAIVLLSLFHALYGRIPLAALCAIGIVGSVALAALFWRLVEEPSMKLGRWLTRSSLSKGLAPTPAASSGHRS